MIPPIERILDVKFSYSNLLLIFNPKLIKDNQQLTRTKEVLQLFDSRLALNNKEKPYMNSLSPDEQNYVDLLTLLVNKYESSHK